eukprot:GHVU01151493.1.p1 GENE.GHVU01151493.1~~GHVU01151493.1.p1  ORF type:complete len:160 (-),score=36.18 GHVU01151493.1:103-582(-)
MAEKVEALYNEFKGLMKLNPERRMDSVKVKEFQEKLSMTMPFWPRDVMKQMEDSKKRKSSYETVAIEEDMKFLSSMMTDRVALCEGNDIKTSNYEEMRQTRKEQQEERQFKKVNRKIETSAVKGFETDEETDDKSEDESDIDDTVATKRAHKRLNWFKL